MKSRYKVVILFLIVMLSLCACTKEQVTGTEKTVLTLASYGDANHPAIRDFNESQSLYTIEVIDYSNNGTIDLDTAVSRLNAEFASGDAPDLLDLYSFHVDMRTYAEKGCLEDLYPYIDNDEELNRTDFVASVFDACSIDGALYAAVSGFGVITVLGSESVLSHIDDWNIESLISLAEEAGGADKLFTSDYKKIGFLSAALSLSTNDYIDFDENTVMFDSNAYKMLLEFCNLFPDETDDMPQEQPVLSYYCINSFMELQYYEAIFDGEVIDLGFPVQKGSGSCFANMMDQFSINAGSQHKEGAWLFLRQFFTEEYQCEQYVDSSFTLFPTNNKAMDKLIEKSLSPLYIKDAEGNTVEVTQRGDQDDFQYHAATKEQIDQMMEIINNTENIYYSLLRVQELAINEAAIYFAGDKSVEEVAETTQNIISTYWAEQNAW